MRLKFTSPNKPRGVQLRKFLEPGGLPEGSPRQFIYEGYVYGLVGNDHANGLRLCVDPGKVAVINLKSLTIRAIDSY